MMIELLMSGESRTLAICTFTRTVVLGEASANKPRTLTRNNTKITHFANLTVLPPFYYLSKAILLRNLPANQQSNQLPSFPGETWIMPALILALLVVTLSFRSPASHRVMENKKTMTWHKTNKNLDAYILAVLNSCYLADYCLTNSQDLSSKIMLLCHI
jgi:hypothetical protein